MYIYISIKETNLGFGIVLRNWNKAVWERPYKGFLRACFSVFVFIYAA